LYPCINIVTRKVNNLTNTVEPV